MTTFNGNLKTLEGKNLLGYQPLTEEEYPHGDWDNAIALFIGKANNPEVFVLRSENTDYCSFDNWHLEQPTIPTKRDDRYKAIGETIIKTEDKSRDKETGENWSNGQQYWVFIHTKTKILKLGHENNDCCYSISLWEVI